jgi:glycosyltransferase involved in cell wall biosynthesis
MKKYLFLANSTKPTQEQLTSREKINLSNNYRLHVEAARAMGYEVFVGANRRNPQGLESNLDVKFYNASTYRSLFDIKSNYAAYKNLMNLLKQEKIDVIHCNTPIGGVMGRLCGQRAKVRRVIYTAHGFHFYEGAPLINRTVFKWAEMWMAHYTDALITMNQEDYAAARKLKLRNGGKVYYIPGVGVDTKAFQLQGFDKIKFRESISLKEDDIVLIAMGDLIPRKNYAASIKAMAGSTNPHAHFLICGRGPDADSLHKLARDLGVANKVHFLGFRTDIKELLNAADIFLFTTNQEGLPRSMMEAMAAGLPCIASRIRGNIDLIEEGVGGYLLRPDDIDGFTRAIDSLSANKALRQQMGQSNLATIRLYDVDNVGAEIRKIYAAELG